MDYQYTNNWFTENEKTWDLLMPQIKPQRILEVGSFEGRSICYMIQKLQGPLEIHAIDSWAGGTDIGSKELMKINPFSDVEARFHANTKKAMDEAGEKEIKLNIHKFTSDIGLARLLLAGFQNYFQYIYIDGSHDTNDTLCDMVLAFKLLKWGGVMCIDDYNWHVDYRPIHRPKLAIDTFINLNLHRIDMVDTRNAQAFIVKVNHLDKDGNYLPVKFS